MIPYTFLKRFAILGGILCLSGVFFACSPKIVQSTVYETRDSIVFKVDTAYIQLPPERVKDYTDLSDTLTLKTDLATAKAWVNPSKEILEGEIQNNPKPIPVPVQSKEEYHQKDSIQIKEVPVFIDKVKEVIPNFFWWSLAFNILTVLAVGLYLYFKLK